MMHGYCANHISLIFYVTFYDTGPVAVRLVQARLLCFCVYVHDGICA